MWGILQQDTTYPSPVLLQVTTICVWHQSELQRLGDEGSAPAVVGDAGGHECILADRLHWDSSELVDSATSSHPSGASTPCVVDSISGKFLPFVVHCLRLQQPIVHGDVIKCLRIAQVRFRVDERPRR